jgi:hypothetical protein
MKKSFTLSIILLFAIAMSSCSNVLDKKINIDNYDEVSADYRKVAVILDKADTLSEIKRKYIKDNLHAYVEFAQVSEQLSETIGGGMGETGMIGDVPTYRQQIITIAAEYDTKLKESNLARENNTAKKLKN